MARQRSSVMWQLPRTFGTRTLPCRVRRRRRRGGQLESGRKREYCPKTSRTFPLMRPASRLNPCRAAIGRNPSTWQGAQVPGANNIVLIHPDHTVTITDTSAVAYTVAIDGALRFAPTLNTRLTVTNLQVMAGADGMGAPGVLEVGTVTDPIAPTVTAEIVIANTPLGGGVADPSQFGTGIIVFGKIDDARQRPDADVRAPRGRTACRRTDVDRVGAGVGMEGRRSPRAPRHPAHQGNRGHRRWLAQCRQPMGRAHAASRCRQTAGRSP